MSKNRKEIAEKIKGNISWENWELDEDSIIAKEKSLGRKLEEEEKYFSTNQVLLNMIDWLQEEEVLNEDDHSEHLFTISQLQAVLGLVDIDAIAEEKEEEKTDDLEKIFTDAKEKKEKQTDTYVDGLRKLWKQRLEKSKIILEKIEFLNQQGYGFRLENNVSFNQKDARNSDYPKVISLRGNIHITPDLDDDNSIYVKSFGNFSLSGEKHTYESFLKKLIG